MAGFTQPGVEGNYSVTYDEDQGRMGVVYDITNVFLDAVIQGNMFPDGFLSTANFPDLESVTEKFPDLVSQNIEEIICANAGILACIILGPLMALCALIGGCYFYCCCGNKKSQASKGGDGFMTVVFSVLLLLLVTIASMGCMWFILGSQTAADGLNDLPEVTLDWKDFLNYI